MQNQFSSILFIDSTYFFSIDVLLYSRQSKTKNENTKIIYVIIYRSQRIQLPLFTILRKRKLKDIKKYNKKSRMISSIFLREKYYFSLIFQVLGTFSLCLGHRTKLRINLLWTLANITQRPFFKGSLLVLLCSHRCRSVGC